jgi:hypothetical protein
MSDVGNNGRFYGQNAPGVEYDRPEGVTYQTMIHAEGEAFAKAAQAGVNGGNADLYVDQEPCSFCRSSFAGLAVNIAGEVAPSVTSAMPSSSRLWLMRSEGEIEQGILKRVVP